MTPRIPDLVPGPLRRAWAAEGHCPDLDLYALFRAHRMRHPLRTAVIDAAGATTYAELDTEARCLAAGLAEAGIRPGDVVGVQLPNSRAAVAADLALAALGAIALPFPVGRGGREAVSLLARSGARAVIAATTYRGSEHARELAERADALPALHTVIAAGPGQAPAGCRSLAELTGDERDFTPVRPDPDTAARLLVSSGSEAEPKMVAYSHNALAGGRGNFLAALLTDGTPPRCLFLVPLASAFGSSGTAVTLARHGGTLVLLDRFTPEAALAAVRAHRPTHVLGVPTMVRMMVERCVTEGRTADGPTALVLGGSALDAATHDEAARVFGCPVVNLYGSADGVNCHTGLAQRPPLPDDGPGIVVGRPDPAVCEIRITPPPGAAADGTGEILARGPMTPLCYVGAPELNMRYRTADGWVRTGDLGTLAADGTLRVVGRLKDIVIRGGANISPAEVEGELSSHPDVRDVICVGVPDPLMGERLAACVVPRAGREITLQSLCAHLDRRGVERRKHPEHLLPVTGALPLTPAGKPDRTALRNRIADGLPAEPARTG
ncbi:class I adenylate-forming enzyme family protein [Streptomyces sp. P9-2B-2]|uniref:class I adenylate-forming enzyme family protein n=1 Tax=Streptomyces TaxID=1883 RepID=UPI002256785D|nr:MULTISPECIES: class I adenylate-forming enzyme family protein [Streptomyces]MCX4637448.1 acyl--CoA ligase [Streptomyces platensis]WJY36402.1 class I adenylate-forming enzyme family protein [Streptomyces sp. P9-2B-2]